MPILVRLMFVVVCTWIALAPSAMAQQTLSDNPSQTAAAFFAALERRDWTGAGQLVDSRNVLSFRERELAVLVAWAQRREEIRDAERRGGDHMVGFSTDGVLRPAELQKHAATPLTIFRGVRTLGEAAALAPSEFVARFLEAAADAVSDEPLPAPRPASAAGRTHRRVIGHVVESDSVAHVLYREEGPSVVYDESIHVEVLHLRRHGDTWRVLLNQDVASLSHLLLMMDMKEMRD